MGIYDRPYYGDEDDRPETLSGQRSMVTNLILLNVAIFLIDVFTPTLPSGGHWLSHTLAFDPQMLTQPWNWWRLLTYGFAHASIDEGGIFHVGFNMYGLWLFGRDVEAVRGRREFLVVYLALIVLSGLIWAILEAIAGGIRPIVGASGAVTGIMILFVCHFPDRRFMLLFFPVAIPAWALARCMCCTTS